MSEWGKPITRRDIAVWWMVMVVLVVTAMAAIIHHDTDGQIDRIREHGAIRALIIERCSDR